MKTKTDRVGRNDPCPCGSGQKYKKCCLSKSPGEPGDQEAHYQKKYGIRLKNPEDIEAIRAAGRLVVKTLELAESEIRAGIPTDHLNTIVHDFTVANGAVPAPLNYRGFPKSVCVSVNEVICHGIPGERILKEGDIVNVDVTSILNGYYADANRTFFVGQPGPDARKIVDVARECLRLGLNMIKPGNTVGDIGWAIQEHAESMNCSVVRDFVGHGVGFDFHEAPQIPHFGNRATGIPLAAGMVFTVEPMINLGKKELNILDDDWTAVTRDGSLSAQFEHTIVVTPTGYESLTPYDLDG